MKCIFYLGYMSVYIYIRTNLHTRNIKIHVCVYIFLYIYNHIHTYTIITLHFVEGLPYKPDLKSTTPRSLHVGSNCRKSLAGSPGITSVLPCENRAGFFWCRRLSSRVVWGKVALGCFDKGWKKVVMHEGFPVNIWICLDFVCGCFYDLDVLFIREFILTNPSFSSWLLGKLNGSIFCGSGFLFEGTKILLYIYICMNGHGSRFSRHAYLYCFASWRMIFQGTMEQ